MLRGRRKKERLKKKLFIEELEERKSTSILFATTMAVGEGGVSSKIPTGCQSGSSKPMLPPEMVTTLAVGEEGNSPKPKPTDDTVRPLYGIPSPSPKPEPPDDIVRPLYGIPSPDDLIVKYGPAPMPKPEPSPIIVKYGPAPLNLI